MSSAKPVIGFRGLKRSGNPLAYPPGSLERAVNCCISAKDVVMPRRGHRIDGRYIDDDDTDAGHNRASEVFQWGEDLVIHYEGDGASGLSAFVDFLAGGDATTLIGAAERPYPETLRMKFAQLVKSLYFTTSEGVKVLDAVTGTMRLSGIQRPGEFQYFNQTPAGSTNNTRLKGNPDAAGAWMEKDTAVGYRATLGHVDANGVVREADANGRLVLRNPADLTVAIGGLARAAGVVTATFATANTHNLRPGDKVHLSPTDAGKFDAGNYEVTAVDDDSVSWADSAHANGQVSTIETTLSSGAKQTQVDLGLPPGLTTDYFARLYRTIQSAGANIDPGNEHYLCIERRLTAADISATHVVFVDTTPDDFLGDDLYLNPNGGDGPLSANNRPPLAADVCTFDNRLFYFRTTDRHRLFLRLLGCGSPDGLQANDILAINDRFYVFSASSEPKVFTEHSPIRNVADTLSSLLRSYNEGLGGTAELGVRQTTARVITDGDVPTGQVLVEQFSLGADAMHAAVSRQSAWADPLPLVNAVVNADSSRADDVVTIKTSTAHGFTAGQQIRLACDIDENPATDFDPGVKLIASVPTSTTFTYAEVGADADFSDDNRSHVVYPLDYESDDYEKPVRFSKQGEPESCPLGYNLAERLPDGATVLRGRASPQNDRLYIFLEGGDVFEVSGTAPYTVRRFDGTAVLLAADSLKEHSGQLYGLTSQGVVAVSDAGVQIVGSDVEDDIEDTLALMEAADVDLATIFAVSDESERQYQLWLPVHGPVAQALVFSSLRGEWMGPWTGQRTCGLVFQGPRVLVFGDGERNQLRIERKSRTFTDFADDNLEFIVDVDGLTAGVLAVTTDPTLTGIGAGDVLEYGDGYFRVLAVAGPSDSAGGLITIDAPSADSDAIGPIGEDDVVTVHKHIPVVLRWKPDSDDQPGLEKHWRQVQLHFKEYLVNELTANFYDDEHTTAQPVTVGNDDFEIGVPIDRLLKKRATVPKNVRRTASLAIELELDEAFSFFKLLGYSTSENTGTEKSGE